MDKTSCKISIIIHNDHNLICFCLVKVGCLLLIELGSRSSVGTTLDSGFGEVKTLSYPSKFGCAVEDQFGFLAPECLTCTGDIRVPLAIVELLATNLMANQLLSGITKEWLRHGLMTTTKNSSTPENHWQDTLTWEILVLNWRWKKT